MTAKPPSSRLRTLALAGGAVGLLMALAVIAGIVSGFDPGDPRELLDKAWSAVQETPPLVFFSVMAIACIFPVPISPFYFAAGPLFGVGPALLWVAPALAINQLAAHALAESFVAPWIEGLVSRRGLRVPKVSSPADQRVLTILVRITPGFPYPFQNWILGLAGVERWRYLAISWPIGMAWAMGWIVFGKSAFEGEIGTAVLAVALLLALGLVARWGSKRLRAAREDLAEPSEDGAA